MQWGSSEKFLREQRRERGIISVALLNKPELPGHLVPVYNAFTILNRTRGSNMAGEQPIKVSEVVAYLSVIGETCPERRARLMRLVVAMDGTYLAHQSKKITT